MRRLRLATARRRDDGASAVEFALVSTLLFPVLLAIVDYGFWFNDSLNTRQGVREAARLGVVKTVSCSGGSNELQKLACMTAEQVAPTTGTVWARVVVPQGWEKAKPLVVCAMVRETAVTGVVPLPNDRLIRSKTLMSIEIDDVPLTGTAASGSHAAGWPASGAPASWDWCTA